MGVGSYPSRPNPHAQKRADNPKPNVEKEVRGMSDHTEKRLSWLAFVYDAAIKHGVFRPADVVLHATPEVLARDLPKELVIRIFEVAFEAGKLTPESILGVTPPSTLVKHIAPAILWEVVRDAATRHGIATSSSNVPKTARPRCATGSAKW